MHSTAHLLLGLGIRGCWVWGFGAFFCTCRQLRMHCAVWLCCLHSATHGLPRRMPAIDGVCDAQAGHATPGNTLICQVASLTFVGNLACRSGGLSGGLWAMPMDMQCTHLHKHSEVYSQRLP